MKYVDEYRDEQAGARLVAALRERVSRRWTVMEICGGQTHTILKAGLLDLLPPEIALVHGPGCPVCVTPVELIDAAVGIAEQQGAIFCSFGDMLRVPGSQCSLLEAKARGADVRVVYSPLDALKLARANPTREVILFAVGFETTAPAAAMAVWQAAREGLSNFSVLVAHVLVPPAIEAILSSPDGRIQGLLAPGHVCTVTGYQPYEELARRHRVPIVVTGFEPLDILQGLLMLVNQLEKGRAEVENQYRRSVRREGNRAAQQLMDEVFERVDRQWRGLGLIPLSGLRLRARYGAFDALGRFRAARTAAAESCECMAGLILQGLKKPPECPAFGTRCTPESPLGAPMVSSEGACAAYYLYSRRRWPSEQL